MQETVQEYLAKAEWCEERAKEAAAPGTRRSYLELARGWREFAAGPLAHPIRSTGLSSLDQHELLPPDAKPADMQQESN